MKLSKDDKFYNIKLLTLKAEKNECLEAAENFDEKAKRQKKENSSSLFRQARRSIQRQQNQKFD